MLALLRTSPSAHSESPVSSILQISSPAHDSTTVRSLFSFLRLAGRSLLAACDFLRRTLFSPCSLLLRSPPLVCHSCPASDPRLPSLIALQSSDAASRTVLDCLVVFPLSLLRFRYRFSAFPFLRSDISAASDIHLGPSPGSSHT